MVSWWSGRYSTRIHLFGLVAAVVVPLTAFAGLVIYRYAIAEQARVEQEAVRIAAQTALLVEAELRQLTARLEGLTSSTALGDDDLERLHTEASRLTQGREETIILRDMGVRQFFNSQLPYDARLPNGPPFSERERESFAEAKPFVSDVYLSPRNQEPRIVVEFPIMRDGEPRYVIGITIPTKRIRDALIAAVPPGYVVAVGDRNGAYVARSDRHEEFTGKPGLPDYVRQVIGKQGSFRSANFSGAMLLAGYYRSDLSGWFFTANIPVQALEAPFRKSLAQLAAFGLAALGVSALLALLFSRGITSAAEVLADRAHQLGQGKKVEPLDFRLGEFAMINDALVSASEELAARDVHRQLLVNELNHRVKNSLAVAQSIALQTLRSTTSPQEARSAISQRIASLALTHDVLTRANWEGADVEDIVAHVIEPYSASSRIETHGPPVRLLPGAALTLSLLLHELITNATKYGAMSTDSGRISIQWRLGEADNRPRLFLTFTEAQGPVVEPPARSGFGSRLFAAGFSSPEEGRIEVRYPSTGVVCEIEMSGIVIPPPLPDVAERV